MIEATPLRAGALPTRSLRLTAAEHRRLRRQARLRRELTGWAFLAPMFAFFVIFLVVPVLGTLWWSTRSGGIASGTTSVGLNNFIRLPGLVGATTAIQNTLVFALLSVPLILIGALGIALVLARIGRGASTYRFLVYFPVLVPGVVAALIWLFLTNIDFGLFNDVLRAVGAPPQTWLGSGTALPVLAVLDVWRNVGYWAIFFVAAIIGLPGRAVPGRRARWGVRTGAFPVPDAAIAAPAPPVRGRGRHDLGSPGFRHGAGPDERWPGHLDDDHRPAGLAIRLRLERQGRRRRRRSRSS